MFNFMNSYSYPCFMGAGMFQAPQYSFIPQFNPFMNPCCFPVFPMAGAYYGSNLGLGITPNSFPYNFLRQNSINPFNNNFLQFNNMPNLFSFDDTRTSTPSPASGKLSKEQRINLLKEYLKYAEGGYACVKGDKGGATKHGVTHFTYDAYRKRKHLPLRSVKEMTEDEFSEIIEYFWEKGGASKVENPILAFYVFSADWSSGIGRGKKFLDQCGGDPKKFEELRRAFYNRIAVGDQARFKKGWQNRVTRDHDFAYSKFANKSFIA